ncbi:hypothetical protein ACVQ92_07260 [Staphylococcus aureus]
MQGFYVYLDYLLQLQKHRSYKSNEVPFQYNIGLKTNYPKCRFNKLST